MTRAKRAGAVTKVVEHLPSKHKALSSNPSTVKKKKKKSLYVGIRQTPWLSALT
jgi:hypothetical protein